MENFIIGDGDVFKFNETIFNKLKNNMTEEIKEQKEKVNHPNHYGGEHNPYEAIRIIEAHELNFSEGNALKYLLRYKKKNGLEDLKKARWYLDRLIQKHPDNSTEKANSLEEFEAKDVQPTPKELLKESFISGIVNNTQFSIEIAKLVTDSVISGLEKFDLFPPKESKIEEITNDSSEIDEESSVSTNVE